MVHGFPDKIGALQFEWAWQHAGQSLHVRNAIGDTEAKSLARKRGTKAALAILKTLMIECSSLCHDSLGIYFLQEKWKDAFDKIRTESERGMPPSTLCKVILSLDEMPFWVDRANQRTERGKKNDGDSTMDDNDCSVMTKKTAQACCVLCFQAIVTEDVISCANCSSEFHEICVELELDESNESARCTESW